jgi:lipoprotein NlpD
MVPPADPGQASPVTPRAPVKLPPPEVVAKLSWRWPTAGEVAKPFGDGAKGVDIGGNLGQPVVAAAPGKVVYSGGALKGYGELIIIKHDDVHLSAYGYNRRRLVGEGATVAAGQPIAELGIGPEQRPVLHFEIRRRGKPVDPGGYLPPR